MAASQAPHPNPNPNPNPSPGALWAGWGPSTFVGGDYYKLQCGTLCALPELAALWRHSGLLPHTAHGCDASAEQARLVLEP